jgi:hypothetical protein
MYDITFAQTRYYCMYICANLVAANSDAKIGPSATIQYLRQVLSLLRTSNLIAYKDPRINSKQWRTEAGLTNPGLHGCPLAAVDSSGPGSLTVRVPQLLLDTLLKIDYLRGTSGQDGSDLRQTRMLGRVV